MVIAVNTKLDGKGLSNCSKCVVHLGQSACDKLGVMVLYGDLAIVQLRLYRYQMCI